MKPKPVKPSAMGNNRGKNAFGRLCADLKKIAVVWPPELPKPDKFPATLKDFFRLIVKAKTPADCMARFRQFLRIRGPRSGFWAAQTPLTRAEADSWAVALIHTINEGDKKEGYFNQSTWLGIGSSYKYWWKAQKSTKAREAAKKRRPAS